MKHGMRVSIRNKILLSTVIINVLICIIMGVAIYNYVYDSFVKSASDDTLALAQISARQINGNLLSLLEPGSEESYAYEVITEDMQSISDNADIHSIIYPVP